ncbi:aminodeoxychorismate synthase component I [soil metagenome]
MELAPIAAAARLAGKRGRVLLHSARDDDGLGRWSFATAIPSAILIGRGRSFVRLDGAGRAVQRFTADPFSAAEAFLAEHGCTIDGAFATSSGPPAPRVIGYLGYDLARVVETLPGGPALGGETPDLWLAAYDGVARWDAKRGATYELAGPDPRALAAALAGGPRHLALPPSLGPLTADDDGGHHMARVERIRDYLLAGDVYQVNLARRHVARVTAPGDPLVLYAALAAASPAPYGALIEAEELALISSSPERFRASTGARIETRPIKGTRPPGATSAADLAAATKDAAEHLMIVDLERNDLGRIAETGSVRVDQLGYVIELPTLLHKVSRVSARPRAGLGYAELLRATFPGGSITGAPKVRAMQLIDELEPARRGPYCGAFGYFAPTGFELALAIRIGVLGAHELRIHVGGGIVADSDPAAELAETEIKAAGWVAALAALARPTVARR